MTYTTFSGQKRFYLWLVLLLLIAMRVFISWFATFGIDAPLIYTRTAELYNTGVLPPFSIHVPITQNAFIPGPGISVIYWLTYVLSNNPIYVGMVTGILQLAGIFILYRLFSRIFSRKTAVITALLMLMNPWLCYYSVGLWNPSLIFLFSSLAFYSLYQLRIDNRPAYWALLSLSLCLAVQVHMSAFLLIVASVSYMLFYRTWPSFKSVLAALGVFLGLFFPYIRYELLSGGANTLALLSGATGTSFKLESLFRALHFSVIFQSAEVAHFAGAGIKRVLLFYGYHPVLSIILIPLSLLTAYFAYVIFWTFIKENFSVSRIRSLSPESFLFLVSFVLNPLIYYFTPRPFSPHNLIVVAPFLWVPVASFIERPGRLYFPRIQLKQAVWIYAVASLVAVYMILVSHPSQVPVKDVIRVAGFIGDVSRTPVYVEGIEEVTQVDALETLHRNYFGRKHTLFSMTPADARSSFLLLDRRRVPFEGQVVFETPTVVVIER